jgi:hypothetical protein
MDNVNLFDITGGHYNKISDNNRENFRVKYTESSLNNCSFIHEFLNPGQNYKLFLDYDDSEMNLNQCIEAIMEHLRYHNIPATESMIKVCSKLGELKFHFVIPALHATVEEQKYFWQGLKMKIDFSVYRKGWFRMPNQKKPATNTQPISYSCYQPIGESELNDFILGIIPWHSKHIMRYKHKELNEIKEITSNLKKIDSEDTISTTSSSLEGGFYDYTDDTKTIVLVHILNNLTPEYYNDYDKWMKIGTILKGAFTDDTGFEMFIWFSKKSSKYPGRNFVYHHYKKWNEDKVTFGSLKFMVGSEIWTQALALGKVGYSFKEN